MIDRAELMRWNAANKRAREQYYAHPVGIYMAARCACRSCERWRESRRARGTS